MPKSHRPYAPAFQRQMVELVRRGRTPEELAHEFEPSAQAIRIWMKPTALDADPHTDGLTTAQREPLRRLRRENRQLRDVRAILCTWKVHGYWPEALSGSHTGERSYVVTFGAVVFPEFPGLISTTAFPGEAWILFCVTVLLVTLPLRSTPIFRLVIELFCTVNRSNKKSPAVNGAGPMFSGGTPITIPQALATIVFRSIVTFRFVSASVLVPYFTFVMTLS
jgi:transposase